MIVSASTWTEPADIYADLCIIGAGAAGLDMARFFNGSSTSVVVLEGGGLEFDAQAQRLHQVLCVGKEIQSRVFGFSPQLPSPYRLECRLRQFGGTTNIWAGRWKAHIPDDFQRKSWIAYSGWPLDYDELVSYYREISRDYEIPEILFRGAGVGGADPDGPAGDPLEYALHYYQAAPLNFNEKFRSTVERSENVTVVLNAHAVGAVADDAAETIQYALAYNVRRYPLRIHASVFVLAAGGLENARLLLNMRTPTGTAIGNRHGVVGRFYMEHPKVLWGRLIPSGRRLKRRLSFRHRDGTIRLSLVLSKDFRRGHRLPHHSTYLYPIPIGANLETAADRITRLPRIAVNRAVKRLGQLLCTRFGIVSRAASRV